jgi:hypothetical protein
MKQVFIMVLSVFIFWRGRNVPPIGSIAFLRLPAKAQSLFGKSLDGSKASETALFRNQEEANGKHL